MAGRAVQVRATTTTELQRITRAAAVAAVRQRVGLVVQAAAVLEAVSQQARQGQPTQAAAVAVRPVHETAAQAAQASSSFAISPQTQQV